MFKAAQPIRIAGRGGRQNLYGELAAEAGIAREVDLSHPASAQLGEDLIGTDGLPNHSKSSRDYFTAPREAFSQFVMT